MSILNITIPNEECCDECDYIKLYEDDIAFCVIFSKRLDIDPQNMYYIPCNECMTGRTS
jgi:predicted nucleic-acid-binding Zn-ribbon protein